jgi:hypothetical protein
MGTASLVGLLTGVLSLAREPLRLTLRVWEVGLSSAASAAKLGLELLDQERSGAADFSEHRSPSHPEYGGNGSPPDADNPWRAEPPVRDEAPPARDAPPPTRDEAPPTRDAPPPARDAPPAVPDELIPDHVDEEVVLVAEVAEEGAEEGVGPELNVEEPWDSYDEMTAPEIRDRLAAADPVLAAAVNLYETTHKSRRTVIEAAERALKS